MRKKPLPVGATRKFDELASLQREKPEEAMADAASFMGGGVLAHAIEHVGDINHRMNEKINYFNEHHGWGRVMSKAKSLHYERPSDWMSFEDEYKSNLQENYKYYYDKGSLPNHTSFEDYKKEVTRLLNIYADEHAKLPVYNDMQFAARAASIALGRQRFEEANHWLKMILKYDKDLKGWIREASKFDLDYEKKYPYKGNPIKNGKGNPMSKLPQYLEDMFMIVAVEEEKATGKSATKVCEEYIKEFTDEALTAKANPGKSKKNPENGASVVIIDDEADLLDILADHASSNGFNVKAYTSWENAQIDPNDIIVYDTYGSGKMPEGLTNKVISMSGSNEVNPDLVKPFDLDKMIEMIKSPKVKSEKNPAVKEVVDEMIAKGHSAKEIIDYMAKNNYRASLTAVQKYIDAKQNPIEDTLIRFYYAISAFYTPLFLMSVGRMNLTESLKCFTDPLKEIKKYGTLSMKELLVLDPEKRDQRIKEVTSNMPKTIVYIEYPQNYQSHLRIWNFVKNLTSEKLLDSVSTGETFYDIYSQFREVMKINSKSNPRISADEFDPQELSKGVSVEMEHTDDPKVAERIAIDHLVEDPNYYTKLARMEAGACSNPSSSDEYDFEIMADENPTKNPIKELESLFYQGMKNSFVMSELGKRLSEAKREKVWRNMELTVKNMVDPMLEQVLGMKLKADRRIGAKSKSSRDNIHPGALQYSTKSGKKRNASDIEKNRQVEKNRYLKLFLSVYLMNMLINFVNITGGQIERFFSLVSGHKDWKGLRDKSSRWAFAKITKQSMEGMLKNFSAGQMINWVEANKPKIEEINTQAYAEQRLKDQELGNIGSEKMANIHGYSSVEEMEKAKEEQEPRSASITKFMDLAERHDFYKEKNRSIIGPLKNKQGGRSHHAIKDDPFSKETILGPKLSRYVKKDAFFQILKAFRSVLTEIKKRKSPPESVVEDMFRLALSPLAKNYTISPNLEEEIARYWVKEYHAYKNKDKPKKGKPTNNEREEILGAKLSELIDEKTFINCIKPAYREWLGVVAKYPNIDIEDLVMMKTSVLSSLQKYCSGVPRTGHAQVTLKRTLFKDIVNHWVSKLSRNTPQGSGDESRDEPSDTRIVVTAKEAVLGGLDEEVHYYDFKKYILPALYGWAKRTLDFFTKYEGVISFEQSKDLVGAFAKSELKNVPEEVLDAKQIKELIKNWIKNFSEVETLKEILIFEAKASNVESAVDKEDSPEFEYRPWMEAEGLAHEEVLEAMEGSSPSDFKPGKEFNEAIKYEMKNDGLNEKDATIKAMFMLIGDENYYKDKIGFIKIK